MGGFLHKVLTNHCNWPRQLNKSLSRDGGGTGPVNPRQPLTEFGKKGANSCRLNDSLRDKGEIINT